MTQSNFTAVADLRRSQLCHQYFDFSSWYTNEPNEKKVSNTYVLDMALKRFLADFTKYDFDTKTGVLLVFDKLLAIALRLEFGDEIRFTRTV